jgi:hypothetical protein
MASRPLIVIMFEWIQANEIVIWWMLATSIVTFVAAMIGAPLWIINIPRNYFSERRRRRKPLGSLSAGNALLVIGRNLLGGILILIGVLMLILPGQGLLTILVGIMLMDLPGKYRIARSIVARPPVLQSMNWIRRRAGRKPLILDK